MSLSFLHQYGCQRDTSYVDQPPLFNAPDSEDESGPEEADLNYEIEANEWKALLPRVPDRWKASDWPERPLRFIDGKDAGYTVAWLRAPGGYPIPVRLSEIGSVATELIDGVPRRTFQIVERVVSMVVDPFPWDEVESFAAALQQHGFRLLAAEPPEGKVSYDFESMRKAAQNRSNDEMGVLEEAAISQAALKPTIIDGRLEPRQGGLDQDHSPAVGVVKTHHKNYLHALGMRLLYDLRPGERTPCFGLREQRFPVVSWYLRLSPAGTSTPNWGIIRVEVPLHWFEALGLDEQLRTVSLLCRMLCQYRCRDQDYSRAAVSLHPIVRAEELLGALFTSPNLLTTRFYRLTGL
jgi:hypothetical protein